MPVSRIRDFRSVVTDRIRIIEAALMDSLETEQLPVGLSKYCARRTKSFLIFHKILEENVAGINKILKPEAKKRGARPFFLKHGTPGKVNPPHPRDDQNNSLPARASERPGHKGAAPSPQMQARPRMTRCRGYFFCGFVTEIAVASVRFAVTWSPFFTWPKCLASGPTFKVRTLPSGPLSVTVRAL